jgi:hypothetical protein
MKIPSVAQAKRVFQMVDHLLHLSINDPGDLCHPKIAGYLIAASIICPKVRVLVPMMIG